MADRAFWFVVCFSDIIWEAGQLGNMDQPNSICTEPQNEYINSLAVEAVFVLGHHMVYIAPEYERPILYWHLFIGWKRQELIQTMSSDSWIQYPLRI